jgi:hypothetical protein
VTSNYFDVLGVDLAAGPGLTGADELRGAAPAAIIGTRLWASLYNNDAQIIGRQLLVNGRTVTVVGVAPGSFDGMTRGERAELWLPVPQFTALRNRPDTLLSARESSWLSLVGRLAHGAPPDHRTPGTWCDPRTNRGRDDRDRPRVERHQRRS